LLGGQDGERACGDHDDVNLERDQFGRKSGEPLELPLGISVFDHQVAALDVTEVTQSLTEGLLHDGISGQVGRQVAYSSDLGRLLGLGCPRRGEEAEDEDDRERSAWDHHAAAFVRWVSTAAIFRQSSIRRNLIGPLATRRKSRIRAASSIGSDSCVTNPEAKVLVELSSVFVVRNVFH
jgi:hypothetical protein